MRRSIRLPLMCLAAATCFAMPALAGQAVKDVKAPAAKGQCETGQVHKWSDKGWVCADDLVGGGSGGSGGGSGPRIVDASGAVVGSALGTTLFNGATVPQVLFTLTDAPKPFLLPVDATGFPGTGRLIVKTTNEGQNCVLTCGFNTSCTNACVTATAACAAANAFLEPLAPASAMFRNGAVVDPTPATAQLWIATSSTSEPIGECVNQGVPACLAVTYRPATNTCTLDIKLGATVPRQAFPATPAVNLHSLHVPPYALMPR